MPNLTHRRKNTSLALRFSELNSYFNEIISICTFLFVWRSCVDGCFLHCSFLISYFTCAIFDYTFNFCWTYAVVLVSYCSSEKPAKTKNKIQTMSPLYSGGVAAFRYEAQPPGQQIFHIAHKIMSIIIRGF